MNYFGIPNLDLVIIMLVLMIPVFAGGLVKRLIRLLTK